MNLQAIAAIANAMPAHDAQPMAVASAAPAATGTPPFGQLVADGLEKVNGELVSSQVDAQKLAAGEAPDLHRVMINMEQAQLSFQLMMQVRNRLLDAYQDVMKMQV